MRSRINDLTVAANEEAEAFHDRLNALDDDIVMLGKAVATLEENFDALEADADANKEYIQQVLFPCRTVEQTTKNRYKFST